MALKGTVPLNWLQSLSSSADGGCTGCIRTDSQPAVGEAGRVPGLEGAPPCSARPKQPVHEPEPSAVHFTYSTFSLDALPAAHFFHPWNGTNPPVLTGATKALGSAGSTPWLLLCILPEKTKAYISLNHVSKQYHLSQTLVGTPSYTYCNDQICLSTFQEYI